MIADFFGDVLAWFVGDTVTDGVLGGKRSGARRKVFPGGIRVVSGRQSGLSPEWLIGEWTIRTGRLSKDTVVVPIIETVAGSRRPAGIDERLMRSETIILTARTETATLEWAMPRRSDGLALRALGVPDSAERRSLG
jgi:hypothetical protein